MPMHHCPVKPSAYGTSTAHTACESVAVATTVPSTAIRQATGSIDVESAFTMMTVHRTCRPPPATATPDR